MDVIETKRLPALGPTMIELVAGTYIISHRLKPWPGALSPSSPPNRVTFGDGIFVWVWHIFFPFLIPFSFFYTLQFIFIFFYVDF